MTASEVVAVSAEDLADMDLLDDAFRHCRCELHQPIVGAAFVALCGKRSLARGHQYEVPPNACPDCLELYRRPCSEVCEVAS